MDKSQEILIQKVMAMMRENLAEPVPIPELAKKVGYSPSHLRLIFRNATGKGILPHLLEMRMDKAKKLLRDTKLPIGEIAFECGFNSYKRFRATFTGKVGCSPGAYRRSQGIAAESRLEVSENSTVAERWFYESFKGRGLSANWKTISGLWNQQDGYMKGTDSAVALILLTEPLPENFELRFETRIVRRAGLLSSEIGVGFCNGDNIHNMYGSFVLGRMEGSFGEFRIHNTPLQLNSKAVLKPEVWHKIRIRLEDDTISLELDGAEMFRHRDPFPPPFSRRSHLIFATTNGEIELRELEITDRGFLPLVKSIRQGDSLYTAGFYSSARDFYNRLLASRATAADVMELRFKIGQCFFQEGDPIQAAGWMEKVIAVPETGFWAEQAKLAILEIDIREDRLKNIEQSFRGLFEKPYYRQSIRQIINRACMDYSSRGFFEKALFLRDLLLKSEAPDTHPYLVSQDEMAEILMLMRRFAESESYFAAVFQNPITPQSMRLFVLFSFLSNLGMQGKLVEFAAAVKELETLTASSPYERCRLIVFRGVYYRAQSRAKEALAELASARDYAGKIPYWPAFCLLVGAHILCSEKNVAEARAWTDEAAKIEPGHQRFSKGSRSVTFYPLELISGNCERAAEYLAEDSEVNRDFAVGAEQAIKAGILFTIGNKQEQAIAIWKRTAELFPENRINFFGAFAKSLISGNLDTADAMPYPAEKRSEIFYLLGLLCESKGDSNRAQSFFKMCATEDPMLHWPAAMARKKVEPRLQPAR